MSGGVPVDYYLDLQEDTQSIRGRVHMTWGWTEIDRSIVNGDTFTLYLRNAIPIHVVCKQLGQELLIVIYDPRTSPFSFKAHPVRQFPELPVPRPLPAIADISAGRVALATPPMGWNSWNHFAERIDDTTVRSIADALVKTGMRDAGYRYLVIDEGWAAARGIDGRLRGNTKFPDMKALADYVHSRGLLFGIYSSPGPLTCGAYTASFGHEDDDARAFALWGVDYLKYDWCSAGELYPQSAMRSVYQKMGSALQRTGRPIAFAICQYGQEEVARWGAAAGGSLWRISADIQDTWDSMRLNSLADEEIPHKEHDSVWNDPDMLEVGNGGMTDAEYRTHMSLWALLGAPLILGNDPRDLDDATRKILLNREVIAIDQDPGQGRGKVLSRKDNIEIWIKPLGDGSIVIGIVNADVRRKRVELAWKDVGLVQAPLHLRDLWAHKYLTTHSSGVAATLDSHQTLLLRVYPS
ncbi:Alpha-galactosidase precursor [Acidisarcina polymorpha]|uniref:Alpha-galactosidase n=1 Tax=Acidisarcina polymorpha TaxID=2211140 RepID=A0A2Z5G5N7_9BACT|nr:glycoside hydrolase family 27 protein [Acidisarcina polymorpha]AXC13945.1 Alpha-galactosidase precursor [Acidisarcina polymorpha]